VHCDGERSRALVVRAPAFHAATAAGVLPIRAVDAAMVHAPCVGLVLGFAGHVAKRSLRNRGMVSV